MKKKFLIFLMIQLLMITGCGKEEKNWIRDVGDNISICKLIKNNTDAAQLYIDLSSSFEEGGLHISVCNTIQPSSLYPGYLFIEGDSDTMIATGAEVKRISEMEYDLHVYWINGFDDINYQPGLYENIEGKLIFDNKKRTGTLEMHSEDPVVQEVINNFEINGTYYLFLKNDGVV